MAVGSPDTLPKLTFLLPASGNITFKVVEGQLVEGQLAAYKALQEPCIGFGYITQANSHQICGSYTLTLLD